MLKIGIQGGQGSFNEEACRTYCFRNNINEYEIVYLYTSDRVLRALENGEVNRGVAAIENSIGGLVWETIHALSEFRVSIVDHFQIPINHMLLAQRGVQLSEIDTIMSHPQALAQTRLTRATRFPHVRSVSGEGILVDQATAARALSQGELPRTTAVIAARVCADLFDLAILAESLQDLSENLTTFLWMSRRKQISK